MKIQWLGHASFKIIAQDGTTLITDPYGDSVGKAFPEQKADIVTCSHYHNDHSNLKAIQGEYELVDSVGAHQAGCFAIEGFETDHDAEGGKVRGKNIMFKISADGFSILHCGDIGHRLTREMIEAIGKVHVLMVPIGGTYTVDAEGALELCEEIKPTMIVPMHYKTSDSNYEIEKVEPFINLMRENEYAISMLDADFMDLDPEDFPRRERVVIMNYHEH